MFNEAEPHIQKIVALTQQCPERFQERCFELLLEAYLASLKTPATPTAPPSGPATATESRPPAIAIPDAIRGRFLNLAKRVKASEVKAAELFDFSVDPFTYHAFDLPGTTKGERMRNVALLLAVKSYLSTGTFGADWKEFRAACVDHGCWDQGNATKYMNNEWFKVASSSENISLSPSGTKAAEALFSRMAGGDESAA